MNMDAQEHAKNTDYPGHFLLRQMLTDGCSAASVVYGNRNGDTADGCPQHTHPFSRDQNDRIPAAFHGTGDIFSSVLAGSIVLGAGRTKALKIAADYTALTIAETLKNPEKLWYGMDFEAVIPELIESLKWIEEE